MPFPSEGTLTTDEREVAVSETWDSNTDWNAAQSMSGVVVQNGVVMLEDLQIQASEANDKLRHRWTLGETDPFVDRVGTADATNNGTTEVTGSWVDGAARDGNGSSDYVDLTTLGSFGSSMDTDFAVALSLQTTATDDFVMGLRDSNNMELVLTTGGVWAGPSGSVEWAIADQDSNRLRVYSDQSVDDGNPRRIVLNKTGNSASALDIWFNQSSVSTTTDEDAAFSNVIDFSESLTLFAWHNGGTVERNLDAVIDDVCIFDASLTDTEIQSYNNPWS